MSAKDPNPLNRAPIWTLTVSTSSAPITHAFKGLFGTSRELITNSADEPVKGLTALRPSATLQKKYNTSTVPTANIQAVPSTNSDYWYGPEHHWLFSGITVNPNSVLVGETAVDYYEVTLTFLWNENGWKLEVPDVGMTYLDGGVRRQAYIEDHNGNYVAAQRPVPLNADGSLKTSGVPDILEFRIYRAYQFTGSFGTPFA